MNFELIASRESIDDQTIWMVTADERGLGLESCRCGQSVIAAITKFHGPAIELEFMHEGSCCRAAFTRDKFQPLTWADYQKVMGLDPDGD
jgi:hypothetical protein